MIRIAILTYAGSPLATEDDALVGSAGSSMEFSPRPWDDPGVDWGAYQAILVRSCWNYDEAPSDFAAWLDRIDGLRVPLWNSSATLRWNTDKRYLRELAARGHRTVETRWVERGSDLSLGELLDETGWDRAVVKPTVSASAKNTWWVGRRHRGRHARQFTRLVADRPVMVQPFVPEILDRGEWSLMFFGGRFSHAVIKRPAAGDFRVQEEFGGRAERATPPAPFREAARQLIDDLPETPVYARVDGVGVGGRFVLMELELIEPCLFLGWAREAPRAFVAALERAARDI